MNPILYPSNAPLDYEAHISGRMVPKFILTPSTTKYELTGPSRPSRESLESFISGPFLIEIKIKEAPKVVPSATAATNGAGSPATFDPQLFEDLHKHFLITDVTLVGSDGSVGANMELLKAQSSVFRTMFSNEENEEYQTNVVNIPDFTKAALEAFVHFLATGQMEAPKDNACDLLLLADKYNVQSLKSKAEQLLLANITTEEERKVYRLFMKVSPQLLEELFVKM